MVGIVESIREGGQVLPDPAERGVRSTLPGQVLVSVGETGASLGRTLAGESDGTEVTFGSSPLGSGRYDFGDDRVELPGSGGGTGSPISNLAGLIFNNADVIASAVGLLVIVYTLGQLFTFNFNIGGSTE